MLSVMVMRSTVMCLMVHSLHRIFSFLFEPHKFRKYYHLRFTGSDIERQFQGWE